MLYVITALDRPGAAELRARVRPEHLEYLARFGDRLRLGGPLLDARERPVGSLLIIAVDDRAAAEAFADGDPYARSGLFEKVEIRPWRAALGNWAG